MKKNIVCFLTLLLILATEACAVPALRKWQRWQQADGTSLVYRLYGDERAHCLVTADGLVLCHDARGDLCYAQAATAGAPRRLLPAPLVAHDEALRDKRERLFVASNALTAQQWAEDLPHMPIPPARKSDYRGQRHALFILMQFTDVRFSRPDIKAAYDSICNLRGFHQGRYKGSVRDYFYEQSDGLFDLQFDVIGPFTAQHNESYYGANGWGKDNALGSLILEAVQAASDSVDFSRYDWNGDGEADQVFILYAGYGEAQYGPEWTIWPCEGLLTSMGYRKPTYHGTAVNTFACSCELHGNEGAQLDGIGTICHEFSHCMGLPDFYNTSNMDDFCMDAFDVMDAGAYNGNGGYCPAAYTGFERWQCGWRSLTELTEPQQITGWKPLVQGGETYVLRNDAKPGEFFFLDNREAVGFDSSLYSTGMVVTHVDFDSLAWVSNQVNAVRGHKRMAILPADGLYDFRTAETDAFPYVYMNGLRTLDSLTDNSRPRPSWFNANSQGNKLLGRPIYSISKQQDGTMSFAYMITLPPTALPEPLTAPRADGAVYNLQGQRVALKVGQKQLDKGIYIVGNRKVLIQ